MSKSRVIVAQPFSDVWTYEHNWQTGLSACVDDCGTCCYAFFCYCCLAAQLFRRTGDCIMMFLVPGSLWVLRNKMRTGFRIRGSMCRDCVASYWCPFCVAVQIKKELDMQEL